MTQTIRLWGLAFLLLIVFVIQLAQWQDTKVPKTVPETTNAYEQYHQWYKRVKSLQAKRKRLEQQLVIRDPDQLVPVLSQGITKVGDDGAYSVQLIGVEPHTQRHRNLYRFYPVMLTFKGNFEGISTVLAVIERITPTVRIDRLSIQPQKRDEGSLLMNITLAPIDKVNTSISTPIKAPAIRRVDIKRNPFVFDGKTVPSAPQVNTSRMTERVEAPLPVLTGILWDETKPLALLSINGHQPQSRTVGDEIYGVRIIQIHPHHVTVKRGTTQYILSLWKNEGSDNNSTPIAFGTQED